MLCKRFIELEREERQELFSFVSTFGANAYCRSLPEMEKDFLGEVFNGGRNCITVWESNGTAVGTLGVITKEAAKRGEVFLTAMHVAPERVDVLPLLLAEAGRIALAENGVNPGAILRLGVRGEQGHLCDGAIRSGFAPAYRMLELRRDAKRPDADQGLVAAAGAAAAGTVTVDGAAMSFVPLAPGKLNDFVDVHNAAFSDTPNGGSISLTEAEEMLKESAEPDFIQLGYVDEKPALVLMLSLESETGWVLGLGVVPRFQGNGLGKVALRHAIAILEKRGVAEVRLTVAETNTRALNLYQRHGFVLDKVRSTWFTGSLWRDS